MRPGIETEKIDWQLRNHSAIKIANEQISILYCNNCNEDGELQKPGFQSEKFGIGYLSVVYLCVMRNNMRLTLPTITFFSDTYHTFLERQNRPLNVKVLI